MEGIGPTRGFPRLGGPPSFGGKCGLEVAPTHVLLSRTEAAMVLTDVDGSNTMHVKSLQPGRGGNPASRVLWREAAMFDGALAGPKRPGTTGETAAPGLDRTQ